MILKISFTVDFFQTICEFNAFPNISIFIFSLTYFSWTYHLTFLHAFVLRIKTINMEENFD